MALEVQQVSYRYKQQSALHQVSLKLAAGEKVVVAGANGSGKSTLLKAMAGLYLPNEGQVTIDGYGSEPGGHLLPGVGLVVANPERYFFAATVQEELAYSLHNRGIKGSALREQMAEVLVAVGLSPAFLPRNPFFLSLGEQRKVGIASILLLKPRYLLLDEPFSNLDSPGESSLVNFLSAYAAAGNTVVVSSHRFNAITNWGERLLVVEAGCLIYDGSMLSWQINPQRPLMLDEFAHLRYALSQKGIIVDYTCEPEMMAEHIIQAVSGKGVV